MVLEWVLLCLYITIPPVLAGFVEWLYSANWKFKRFMDKLEKRILK